VCCSNQQPSPFGDSIQGRLDAEKWFLFFKALKPGKELPESRVPPGTGLVTGTRLAFTDDSAGQKA
jgi:hypothetical protein